MSSNNYEKFDVKVRDFCGRTKIFFIVTLSLVVLSVLSTFTGVDIALEFKGGTIITYSYEGEMAESDIEAELTKLVGSGVRAQQGESLNGSGKTMTISFTSTEGLTAERQAEVSETIKGMYPDSNLAVLDSNDVDARSGGEFFTKCIVAAIFAAVVLILYIAFRFRMISGWSSGVCAIVGLIVTLIVTYGGVALCGFDIDSNFMAVILTLLGYAVNDTIVIYDRIRENQERCKGMSIEELVNISNSQSLRRTMRTSITTVFAMIAVSVVAGIMGVNSILSFSIPMVIGIIAGTFNSMCFVPTLWVFWQKKRGNTTVKYVKAKKAV
ncbi:MAG: protein translocase subunit SecF [Oscillospiraceae bacterium]|nr:protein translocase subunit SecF [Oscillospiraceae bacterium]